MASAAGSRTKRRRVSSDDSDYSDTPAAKSTTCSVNEETKTIAARLVSDILDRYCKNEKKLSDGRQLETEKVTQMLEAQRAASEAQQAASEAQKVASEAQKAASDATRLVEEARLSTLKFAFEHKLALTSDEPVVSKVPAPAPASVPASASVPATATAPATAPISTQPAPAMPQTLSSLQSQPLSLQQMQQFQQMQQLQSMMLMYPQQAAPQFYPQPFPQANPQPVVSQQQHDSLET